MDCPKFILSNQEEESIKLNMLLGLNEMYVWFLLAYLPYFFH